MVHDLAGLENDVFVVQVDLVYWDLGSVIVEIVIFHRLKLLVHRCYLRLFSFPISIEAHFPEHTRVIGEQILGISEGVLFTSNAHSELVWQLISKGPPISYLAQRWEPMQTFLNILEWDILSAFEAIWEFSASISGITFFLDSLI